MFLTHPNEYIAKRYGKTSVSTSNLAALVFFVVSQVLDKA